MIVLQHRCWQECGNDKELEDTKLKEDACCV